MGEVLCPLCSVRLPARRLDLHLRKELAYAPFACLLCRTSFSSIESARLHFGRAGSRHPETEFHLRHVREDLEEETERKLHNLNSLANVEPVKSEPMEVVDLTSDEPWKAEPAPVPVKKEEVKTEVKVKVKVEGEWGELSDVTLLPTPPKPAPSVLVLDAPAAEGPGLAAPPSPAAPRPPPPTDAADGEATAIPNSPIPPAQAVAAALKEASQPSQALASEAGLGSANDTKEESVQSIPEGSSEMSTLPIGLENYEPIETIQLQSKQQPQPKEQPTMVISPAGASAATSTCLSAVAEKLPLAVEADAASQSAALQAPSDPIAPKEAQSTTEEADPSAPKEAQSTTEEAPDNVATAAGVAKPPEMPPGSAVPPSEPRLSVSLPSEKVQGSAAEIDPPDRPSEPNVRTAEPDSSAGSQASQDEPSQTAQLGSGTGAPDGEKSEGGPGGRPGRVPSPMEADSAESLTVNEPLGPQGRARDGLGREPKPTEEAALAALGGEGVKSGVGAGELVKDPLAEEDEEEPEARAERLRDVRELPGSPRSACLRCDEPVPLNLRSRRLHAAKHLNEPLHKCVRCDESFTALMSGQVKWHARKEHGVEEPKAGKDFDDLTDRQDVAARLQAEEARCFGSLEVHVQSTCALCQTQLGPASEGLRHSHVREMHLDDDPMACRRCPSRRREWTVAGIHRHVVTRHLSLSERKTRKAVAGVDFEDRRQSLAPVVRAIARICFPPAPHNHTL